MKVWDDMIMRRVTALEIKVGQLEAEVARLRDAGVATVGGAEDGWIVAGEVGMMVLAAGQSIEVISKIGGIRCEHYGPDMVDMADVSMYRWRQV